MDDKELLQKIDVIRERLGVSYREASEALQATGGEVLEALAALEEKYEPLGDKLEHAKEEAVDRFKSFLRKGADTKIRIKSNQKTILEFPATWGIVGLAGTLLKSELALVGVVATATALAKDWKMEIVPKENEAELTVLATEGEF